MSPVRGNCRPGQTGARPMQEAPDRQMDSSWHNSITFRTRRLPKIKMVSAGGVKGLVPSAHLLAEQVHTFTKPKGLNSF